MMASHSASLPVCGRAEDRAKVLDYGPDISSRWVLHTIYCNTCILDPHLKREIEELESFQIAFRMCNKDGERATLPS